MRRKAKGLDAQMSAYSHTARELAAIAKRDQERERLRHRIEKLESAARLALAEISQFHSLAYPRCTGGCPAHEAMSALECALGEI